VRFAVPMLDTSSITQCAAAGANSIPPVYPMSNRGGRDFAACGEITIGCHPERSEGLPFARCQGKSRFLTPQTPFGMTD
jgi:hypothetical protein